MMRFFESRVSLIAAAILPLAFAGCATGPGEFGYDNPKLRKLQRVQSAHFIPHQKSQEHFIRQFGPKVWTIRSGDPSGKFNTPTELIEGGRGAAITNDGYFLTAHHVIEGPAFFLTNLTEKPIRGRLVWADPVTDLAVVKFPKSTPNYFRKMLFPVSVHTTVLSTDDQGITISLEGSQDQGVGNGPFFSAGNVLSHKPYGGGPGHTIMTSLVGRGGMSGSPLVTQNGELCGILSRVNLTLNVTSAKVWKSSRTTARMMSPNLIRAIIQKDRASF